MPTKCDIASPRMYEVSPQRHWIKPNGYGSIVKTSTDMRIIIGNRFWKGLSRQMINDIVGIESQVNRLMRDHRIISSYRKGPSEGIHTIDES